MDQDREALRGAQRDRKGQAGVLDGLPRCGRRPSGVPQGVQPAEAQQGPWSTLRLGVSAYHLALLIDTQKGRTGIELYVDDDKEIGHRAIANSGVFEDHLGLTAVTFDAKKASGLRFYKAGHPIKGHQDAWPGYIEEQLGWALEMKKIIAEIEL